VHTALLQHSLQGNPSFSLLSSQLCSSGISWNINFFPTEIATQRAARILAIVPEWCAGHHLGTPCQVIKQLPRTTAVTRVTAASTAAANALGPATPFGGLHCNRCSATS
jgi:hypothetical protein